MTKFLTTIQNQLLILLKVVYLHSRFPSDYYLQKIKKYRMDSIELWFSDSSDDSSEELILDLRRERRRIRDSSNPLEMDTNKFIANYRLSKDAFLYVLQKIDNRLPSGSRSNAIPNILKFAVTLRFLAQGSYQLCVGNEGVIGCAQPTVSVILRETLDVMENTLCAEFINFAYSAEEEDAAKLHFFNVCKIPGVLGAIDGTHVRIVAPVKGIQHLYYNRKGFYSINVLLVCDQNMKVRYINATHPGSSHDSLVFNVSSLKSVLESRHRNGVRNSWLLGDAGYALKPYLLTPYRSAVEGSVQSIFNIQHAKGRNIIERTIGVLKNRWRCVLGARALHYCPEKATTIINVSAALHNICRVFNIPDVEDETSNFNEVAEPMNVNIPFVESDEAEAIRTQIATFLT